jgi:hypothetical protein
MPGSLGKYKYITKYSGCLVNSALVWFLLYIIFCSGNVEQLVVNLSFLVQVLFSIAFHLSQPEFVC